MIERKAAPFHADSHPDILDALPLPAIVWDSRFTVVCCSASIHELLGQSAGELRNRHPVDLKSLSPSDRQALEKILRDLLDTHGTVRHEIFTHQLKNQQVFKCEWHLARCQPDAEQPPFIVAQLNRMHEQHSGLSAVEPRTVSASLVEQELFRKSRELNRLNKVLREQDKRLTGIIQNAPVGIGIVTPDRRFTHEVNPAYCQLLGYTVDELQQLSLADITHPDDYEDNLGFIETVMSGEVSKVTYEKRYIRKDGEVVWVIASMSPLLDDLGNVQSYIAVVEDITASKESEIRMAQSEELTRIAGELSGVGAWMRMPGEQNALYWSDELYRIYDYDGDSPPSISAIYELVKPEYREESWQQLQDMVEHGKSIDYELELVTFKGREIWLRVVGEPQRNENGEIEKIYGAVQDITERKRQESEQNRLKDRLATTLDSMSEAFYILDENWCFSYMNPSARKILKLDIDMDSYTKLSIWEKQPWLKNTPIYKGFHEAVRNNTSYHSEFFSQRLQEWLEVFAHPSSEGLAVSLHSISDRKLMAAQIAQSEERLKFVTKATLDVIWEREVGSGLITWHDGLTCFGYHDESDTGQTQTQEKFWIDNIHPDERSFVLKSIRQTIYSDALEWESTYRFRKADGSWLNILDRGVVIRNSEGEALRLIGGMSDITERVKLEEHLQHNQRIESIGKLTGGMAHDFNNLLTVIMGNAEMLELMLDSESQKIRQTISCIIDASQKGAELTRRLLAFARRQALEPVPTDLGRLIFSMEGMLRRTLGEQISVRLKISRALNHALVDKTQLENALLNLCINSRDAMPEGGEITIEVINTELTQQSQGFSETVIPGEYVAISVSDTGSGIPQEMLEHVFEPFFTTKELGKGTGLGLSTVFGFVKQSNGYITIDSRTDQGTQIILYLPASEVREKNLVATAVKNDIPEGTETILLVEDDPSLRNFSYEFLSSLGYRVLMADRASIALEVLHEHDDIDLLFTDVVMPGGMDGSVLANEALKIYPDLKVLFTSGYTEKALLRDGKLDMAINLLAKPYTLEKMAGLIRKTLDSN